MEMINDTNMSWITDQLPDVETIALSGEPDYYGASYLIAAKLGKPSPPLAGAATWLHGWLYKDLTHVRQIIYTGDENDVHLVATEEQARFARGAGFKKTVAVGLPLLYAQTQAQRRPGSLLIMPAHSMPYTEHGWNMDEYAAHIAQLKPRFSCIVACVSAACVAKGYWTRALEDHGIPWIVGAAIDDKNALVRMSRILQAFEYMTTNVIGSHVAYAAYAGCKVSLYGPYVEIREEEIKDAPLYKQYPEVLKANVAAARESTIRKRFPELFVAPGEAVERREWGREMLGEAYRRSPRKIARLLGWPDWRTEHLRPLLGRVKRKTVRLMGLRP